MGRAIVREPAAFLLDEPLSNLDARLRVQMRTEIARLQKRLRTTTIYVTHDQAEAMTLGDRVAVLRAGTVQQVGTPRELYESPANLFVAGFIGSPGMNFLPARLEGRRLRLPMVSVELPDSVANAAAARLAELREGRSAAGDAAGEGSLIAGIRPECIREAQPGNAGSGAAFRVRAEVVEWMGAETFVHFAVGDVAMVARIGGASEAREDHEIDLEIDPGDPYLFDAVDGRRIV
jgi:multiple sugar transport system ATP-binding protein